MRRKNVVIISLLFLLIVNCNCTYKNNQDKHDYSERHKQNELIDSFIFSTARKDVVYRGERVFPVTTDSSSFNKILKMGVYLCLKSNDTLYVLVDYNYVSSNYGEAFYPIINQTTIKDVYSIDYKVTYDDDLPYYIYIENQLDNIVIRHKKESENFSLVSAVIGDSLFRFHDIQVGQRKNLFLKKIGLEISDSLNVNYLVLEGFSNVRAWYTKYVKTERSDVSDLTYTVLIRFRDNKIDNYSLGSWIDLLDWEY